MAVDAYDDGVAEALIAALRAAGVRPVGFGTVWTRGSSATSSAAISSVRSAEGPSAITTSISPAYSCSRMCRTEFLRWRSSLSTGMITETAGYCAADMWSSGGPRGRQGFRAQGRAPREAA